MAVDSQRQKVNSWRHSSGDHTLFNPVSVVILEWTLCDVIFYVILFGVCTRSVSLLTSCDVTRQTRPTQPSRRLRSSLTCGFVLLQVNERGGAREEREERGKQNGGLYEEEPAPKQHRKPERTLRYTDTTTHMDWTPGFHWGLIGDSQAWWIIQEAVFLTKLIKIHALIFWQLRIRPWSSQFMGLVGAILKYEIAGIKTESSTSFYPFSPVSSDTPAWTF